MLYERDYSLVNETEKFLLKKAEEYLEKNRGKLKKISHSVLMKYYELRPEASYYHKSPFPNNFLSTSSLEDKNELKRIETEFQTLIDTNPTEWLHKI